MNGLTALPRERKLAIAGAGLVLFLVSLLFLDWFGPFRATDLDSWWIALVLAVLAAGVYIGEMFRVAMPAAWLTTNRALILTGLVAFWTVTHFIDGSVYKVGAWLGLIGSLVALAGAWLVETHR